MVFIKGIKKFLRKLKNLLKKKIKFGVLTFTPLPVMFFNKKSKIIRLASEDQKFELFKKHQVDFVINIKFNKNFSEINAEDFIKKLFIKKSIPNYFLLVIILSLAEKEKVM